MPHGRQWSRLIDLLGGEVPESEGTTGWWVLYKQVDATLERQQPRHRERAA